jgi:predicted nucleotidyltransferase component of viral defense system
LNGLRPWQQEKHYVQSLILNAISEWPLIFKGGTYLWFFHGLRRFSEDLDFTASENLPEDLAQKTSNSLDLFGIENLLKVITNDEKTLSFRISANGPLNTNDRDRCIVYIEISKRETVIERGIPLRFDHPEYQLPVKRLLGMNLEEVGAEKIRDIFTRKKARDVYDLYYLVAKKKIGFKQHLIEKKLEYYKMSFSEVKFLQEVETRKNYFSKELIGIVFDKLPEFGEVDSTIRKWIM